MDDHAKRIIHDHIQEHAEAVLSIAGQENVIAHAAYLMADTIANNGKVVSCGNGGSMSDAMHFNAELVGKFMTTRKPYPGIVLSDPAALTCIANDFGFEFAFSRQIMALCDRYDLLFALSTSGKSKNFEMALKAAMTREMRIVTITKMTPDFIPSVEAQMANIAINTQSTAACQEATIMVIHTIIKLLEARLV